MTAPAEPAERRRLLQLATRASVITALLLIIGKLAAWLATGSVSLLASLVDSTMDALASIINLVAVRYALQPADEDHRHGHGKAEALAGLGQATFIAGSALFLALQSIDRLLNPREIAVPEVGVWVMGASILATGVLIMIQRHVIQRTGSTAIKADSLHYFTDLVTNAGILGVLLLASFGIGGIDPWVALAISAYITHSAWEIGREAIDLLMDRELPPEVRARILEIARAPALVLGVHDLRTHQSGDSYRIQMHLEFSDELRLVEAHAAADQVERALRAEFPDAEVIVHEDPIGVVDRSRVHTEA